MPPGSGQIELSCSFEGCSRHFARSDRAVVPGRLAFCSNSCRASYRFLIYAREVLPLKAEHASHRQIGEVMGGVDKWVAARRWLRFRTSLPRYPELALICDRMRDDLSERNPSL